jgi:IclR family transcriptional regulator, pca regulon regulatory protein
MENTPPDRSKKFIQSLRKGLLILEAFPKLGPQLRLTDLAQSAGLSLVTATKYVHTLSKLGYLDRDSSTKKYRLATKILSFGFSMLKEMDLRTRVTPYLTDVTKEYQIGSQCAILDGPEIVYVERLRSQAIVALDLTVGSRLPAYCTALGRAILAFLEPELVQAIASKMDMNKLTPYTVVNKDELYEELDLIRQRGYAINIQELVIGWSALAAPVFQGGTVEGSFGFSFPSQLMDDKKLSTSLINRMMEIARKVSVG